MRPYAATANGVPQPDSAALLPWVYYLLGANSKQLAVYHGQGVVNMYCSDSTRRVWMYPWEYLTYGAGGTARIVTRPWNTKEYVVADHLGSQRTTVETGGAVLATNDSAPFGELLAVAGVAPRKGYIDTERERESALQNTGVRQKDGGRLLSMDPLWEKYRALMPCHDVANSPLTLSDQNRDAIGSGEGMFLRMAMSTSSVRSNAKWKHE